MLKSIKARIRLAGIAIGALLASLIPTHAHHIIGNVYPVGETMHGFIGYSNGDYAPNGTVVELLDANDQVVDTVRVDNARGEFKFNTNDQISSIKADLGMGHIFEQSVNEIGVAEYSAGAFDDDNANIDSAIARQLAPIRRQLSELSTQTRFRDIVGGIGYIFGLLGLYAYFLARRARK